MRRNQPRGASRDAARCAALSTVALLGCAVAHGSLRAVLAFIWVILLIAAFALEWTARRRLREVQAAQAAKGGSRRAGGRTGRRAR
jgi:hypothetical protein